MKAITLQLPWPWCIAHSTKRIENRTWRPPAAMLGERIAIHAGMKTDAEGLEWLRHEGVIAELTREQMRAGAIVCTAVIDSIVTESDDMWFTGPFGWVLRDVETLVEPIPCKGAQGLWVPPVDVQNAIMNAPKVFRLKDEDFARNEMSLAGVKLNDEDFARNETSLAGVKLISSERATNGGKIITASRPPVGMMSLEQARGTLGAFIAGGDELGDVSEYEATAALELIDAELARLQKIEAAARYDVNVAHSACGARMASGTCASWTSRGMRCSYCTCQHVESLAEAMSIAAPPIKS